MMRIIDSQLHALTVYFQTGGLVMIPLLLVSLFVWLLIAQRWLYLRRMGRNLLGNEVAWRHICDNTLPPQGGIIGLLTRRFMAERSGERELDRRILDEAVISSRRPLNSYLSVIGTLTAMLPLLGLLGTVTGMMNTFEVMSLFGTGDAKGMASGISEALITTETGLIMAIPAMYMKDVLERQAENLERKVVGVSHYLRRRL